MKKLLIAVLIILSALPVSAAPKKIVVMSFKDPAMTKAVTDFLGSSGKFDVRVEDLELLRTSLSHERLGSIIKDGSRWGADFIIIGSAESDGPWMNIRMEMIGVKSGRFISIERQYIPEETRKTAGEILSEFIKKSDRLNNVIADRIVDAGNSAVGFDIRTTGPEIISFDIYYDIARPEPELKDMKIGASGIEGEGARASRIISSDGETIELNYFYKDGRIDDLKISSDMSVPNDKALFTKNLSVLSVKGNILNFTFVWQYGRLSEVRIEPLVNPYSRVV